MIYCMHVRKTPHLLKLWRFVCVKPLYVNLWFEICLSMLTLLIKKPPLIIAQILLGTQNCRALEPVVLGCFVIWKSQIWCFCIQKSHMSDHRRISANEDGGYPKTSQETCLQTHHSTCVSSMVVRCLGVRSCSQLYYYFPENVTCETKALN